MRGRRTISREGSDQKQEKQIMGWSEVTRLHRGDFGPSDSDRFPELQAAVVVHLRSEFLPPSSASNYNINTTGSTSATRSQHGSQNLLLPFSLVVSGTVEPAAVVDELKLVYSWADCGLIEDVLASVGGDKRRAIESLDSMTASLAAEALPEADPALVSAGELEKRGVDGENDAVMDRIRGVSLDEAVLAHEEAENCCKVEEKEEEDCDSLKVEKGANIAGLIANAPVEPEWKQDDPYLAYRSDALRAARAAHRHARGAVHAFDIGDHRRAKVLSAKAQEEHIHARTLNAKAALEILRAKNMNRDMWSLDLHGLHSSEAIDALQDRLLQIELAKRTSLSSGWSEKVEKIFESQVNSFQSDSGRKKCTEPKMPSPNVLPPKISTNKELTVIVGSGTHSHGDATLPNVIKDYLLTNQYQFYEPRSGVIIIRPKRRCQNNDEGPRDILGMKS